MAIAFKDDRTITKSKSKSSNSHSAKIALKPTSGTKLSPREKLERNYMPRHSHTGFAVVIILLSLVAIAAPIGVFFWAKGIGWDEGRESMKDEYMNGYNAGYAEGYEKGDGDGFRRGYNDPHCVYSGGSTLCRLLPNGIYY